MKTNRITTMARLCGLIIGLALLSGASSGLRAGEIPTGKGGATKLLELSGRLVTPKVETAARNPMLCAKCKDELVTRTDWTVRGANKPVITVASHLCGGCGNEWVVSGHGKAKTSTAVHTCTSCGTESLACCSISKGGVAATKGMEKKFEVAPVK
ncbi:MAG: hypothetical protein HY043_08090 [Verrucomicrobia bacterium]|nr:hypothetical protein [Verrucomicrobiota bacterium]